MVKILDARILRTKKSQRVDDTLLTEVLDSIKSILTKQNEVTCEIYEPDTKTLREALRRFHEKKEKK